MLTFPCCCCCCRAQYIAEHLLPIDTAAAGISSTSSLPWQMRSIPGLTAGSSSSIGHSVAPSGSSSSAASIPCRLRQVQAVELPAAAAAGDAEAAGAVLVLAGGGRVRAGDVSNDALADVAEHEVSHAANFGCFCPCRRLGALTGGRGRQQTSASMHLLVAEHEVSRLLVCLACCLSRVRVLGRTPGGGGAAARSC